MTYRTERFGEVDEQSFDNASAVASGVVAVDARPERPYHRGSARRSTTGSGREEMQNPFGEELSLDQSKITEPRLMRQVFTPFTAGVISPVLAGRSTI